MMGQVEKATYMQSKKPSVYQVGYGRPPEHIAPAIRKAAPMS
jgi:hypothetical protein